MAEQLSNAEKIRLVKEEAILQLLQKLPKKDFAELYCDAQRNINGPLLDNKKNTVSSTDEFMRSNLDEESDQVVKAMDADYARSLAAFELDFQRRWIPKMTDKMLINAFSDEHAVAWSVLQEMIKLSQK